MFAPRNYGPRKSLTQKVWAEKMAAGVYLMNFTGTIWRCNFVNVESLASSFSLGFSLLLGNYHDVIGKGKLNKELCNEEI